MHKLTLKISFPFWQLHLVKVVTAPYFDSQNKLPAKVLVCPILQKWWQLHTCILKISSALCFPITSVMLDVFQKEIQQENFRSHTTVVQNMAKATYHTLTTIRLYGSFSLFVSCYCFFIVSCCFVVIFGTFNKSETAISTDNNCFSVSVDRLKKLHCNLARKRPVWLAISSWALGIHRLLAFLSDFVKINVGVILAVSHLFVSSCCLLFL